MNTVNTFALESLVLSATSKLSITSSVSVRYVVPIIALSVKVNAVNVGTLTSNAVSVYHASSSGRGS